MSETTIPTNVAGPAPQAPRERSLRQRLTRMRAMLRSRPDSEHEMMPNRIAFSVIVLGALGIGTTMGHEASRQMLADTYIFFGIYFLVTVGLFAHILMHPQACPPRRVFAMVHDFSMISVAAWAGGLATGFFYPLYLWTVIGNGFRFGVPYLYTAMAMALVALTAVLVVTGIWWSYPGLSLALLIGMVLLPLYAAVLIGKLSEAKRQAEEANRAKSIFLASVSHELRTPLNAIIGLSELLRQQPLKNEQGEMVGTISAAGQSLLTLINSILDFTRIEAGRMPMKSAEFDLYALMRKVRCMLAVQAQTKSLDLALHITPRTPRMISADTRHLEEILVNLTANAVKFTLEGSVVVAVDAVEDDNQCVRLRFEVTDTGIGIAPEAQKRIFDSFAQADETIIDRFGGTGLGLAICKQLVALMGGNIGLESVPGEGSTFWFEIEVGAVAEEGARADDALPVIILLGNNQVLEREIRALGAPVSRVHEVCDLAALLAAESGPAVAVVDASHPSHRTGALVAEIRDEIETPPPMVLIGGSGTGLPETELRRDFISVVAIPPAPETLRQALLAAAGAGARGSLDADSALPVPQARRAFNVLVAEDNATNRMVIAKVLEQAGHQPTLVGDGEEALDALRADDFDVVLMDVNMPTMNGIEATKLYRFASLGQERVPIVALTADATPETQTRCEEAGMDACVTKPVQPAHLLDILEQVVPQGGGRELVMSDVVAAGAVPLHRDDDAPLSAVGPIDLRTLEDLEHLGGHDFTVQLVEQFLEDAERLLQQMSDAVADGDILGFRSRSHALGSAAANVGARAVFELCRAEQGMTSRALAERADDHVRRLGEEIELARHALREHVADVDARMPVAFPAAEAAGQ